MWGAPPHMDGEHITGTKMNRAVEVLHNTTQGAVGIMHRKAREVVHPRARLTEEKFGMNTWVGMGRKAPHVICPRITETVVSAITFLLETVLWLQLAVDT